MNGRFSRKALKNYKIHGSNNAKSRRPFAKRSPLADAHRSLTHIAN
jgi:hypothetical protein